MRLFNLPIRNHHCTANYFSPTSPLLLRIKNIILPSMPLLSPPLRPNHPLPHRPSKSPKHTLTSNINSKLSTPPPRVRTPLEKRPDPGFRSHSLGYFDTSSQVPEVPVHTLELGFDFAFQEVL